MGLDTETLFRAGHPDFYSQVGLLFGPHMVPALSLAWGHQG